MGGSTITQQHQRAVGGILTLQPPDTIELLNAQPTGFYAPAQIVRDAREHGIAARLADVLARIAEHPVQRLDELLPWNWKPAKLRTQSMAA